MPPRTDKPQSFKGKVIGPFSGRVLIPLRFDPTTTWGKREKYRVAGMINEMRIRGVVEPGGTGFVLPLGPAWRKETGVGPGDEVEVTLSLEGPQRDELATDLTKALKAVPEAARFWDSIAQFYRKAYLRWIDATKQRPEERKRRIEVVVRKLKAGQKER